MSTFENPDVSYKHEEDTEEVLSLNGDVDTLILEHIRVFEQQKDIFRKRLGLAPCEPTVDQNGRIHEKIATVVRERNQQLSLEDFREIIKEFCPTTGTWKYGGYIHEGLRKQLEVLRSKTLR